METLGDRTKKDILEDIKKSEDNLMELFKQINKERNRIIELNEELDKVKGEKGELINKDISEIQSTNSDKRCNKRGSKNCKVQCTGQAYSGSFGDNYSSSIDQVVENEAAAKSMAVGMEYAESLAMSWLTCECKDCDDKCYCCICKPIQRRCRK